MSRGWVGSGDDSRGQSEVVGVVLLLAITIAGATAIVAFGAVAVNDTEQAATSGAAEQSMTQLDSKASLVAHGQSDSQRVKLSGASDAQTAVDSDAGWMNITVRNETTGAVEQRVMNETLGAVVYSDGDVEIAYQGGGVWRSSGNGSVMVSPPEFHYQGTTLTLPLVSVNGSGSFTDSARITQDGAVDPKYPNSTRSNPLQRGNVVIKVQSQYYDAWGRFFEQRTGGQVTVYDSNQTVVIKLVTPTAAPGVNGAIISGAGAGTLQLDNNNAIDSYNSSAGTYATTSSQNTSVVAAGDVVVGNQADVKGDLEAGGSVTLENKGKVYGNTSHGGSYTEVNNGETLGWVAANSSVPELGSVAGLIEQKKDGFKSNNNNSAESAIDDTTDRLQGCSSTCEVDDGDYYLDKIALGTGDELVLNTSDGPVEIAVDGDMQLTGDATVRVVGGGVVRFYIEGDLNLENTANVSVPGERAPGLWLYMNPGQTATIQNEARLVGVVYGPGGDGRNGVTVDLQNKPDVFGGLVGEVDDVPNKVEIHFDEALVGVNPLPPTGNVPSVTYLHVSVTTVNVTAG